MRFNLKSSIIRIAYFLAILIAAFLAIEISDRSFFFSANNFLVRILNFSNISTNNVISLNALNIQINNLNAETSSFLFVLSISIAIGVIYLFAKNLIIQTTFYLVTVSVNLMTFVILISSNRLWPFLQIVILSSIIYLINVLFSYYEKILKVEQMQKALGTFVNKKVSEDLLNGTTLRLSGEQRFISVMFMDIRDFTTLTENMKVNELLKFLNGYLAFMSNIILKNGGTIDKYIGDSIMALWNAPVDIKFHAYNSIMAALDIVANMKDFQIKNSKLPKIKVGIGISTGPTVVGNIGTEAKLNYTVIGDNVNLASRIEGLTKKYRISILVTDTTAEECQGSNIIFREIDTVLVKGRKKPVKIFEPMLDTEDNRRIKEKYEKALSHYYAKEFDEARDHFINLEDRDETSRVMHKRIISLRDNEDDFKGVWKWNDK
ncbi:MAG: adenylate/guanylate cyclase domain-containing protein [Candidatus Dojkabacteria bacterium]